MAPELFLRALKSLFGVLAGALPALITSRFLLTAVWGLGVGSRFRLGFSLGFWF